MENSPAAARARRSFFGVARPTLRLTAGAEAHPRARRRSSGPIDAAAAAPPPAAHFGLIHANASRLPTSYRSSMFYAAPHAIEESRVCGRPNFSLCFSVLTAAAASLTIVWQSVDVCVCVGARVNPLSA